MSRLIYLNRPSEAIALDLVVAVSGGLFGVEDVTLHHPTIIAPGTLPTISRNTRAVVRGKPNSKVVGEKPVYYNRLDLGVLFGVEEAGIPTSFDTIEEAVELLNQYYGLEITPEEVDLTAPVVMGQVDIIIKNSFTYAPGSKIRLLSDTDLAWFENAVDRYYDYVNFGLADAVGVVT